MKSILYILLFVFCPALLLAQRRYNSYHRYSSSSHRTIRHEKEKPAEKFYLRAGIGYAFTHAGQVNDLLGAPYSGNATYTNNGTTIASYKLKKASFGAGFYATVAAGYMFTPHIGAELSGSFGLAPKKYTFNATQWVIYNTYTANTEITEQAKLPIFLTPSIVLRSGGKKVDLYTRLGVVVPLNTKTTSTMSNIFTDATGGPDGIHTEVINNEASYSFSLGLSGAIGISTQIDEHIKLWGEINAMSLSADVKNEKLTAYSRDGVSYPPYAVTPNNTNFGLKGSNANLYTATGTQPTTAVPYSNIGISIGVTMDL